MVSALPSGNGGNNGGVTPIRDTSGQDRPLDPEPGLRTRRYKQIGAGVGALLVGITCALLVRSWLSAERSVPRERVRIAEVVRGPFVRDVAAQGTVVAAASPTLYSAASGVVHHLVQPGDAVRKGQPLAELDSPELREELAREKATLAAVEVAVQRAALETRRQLLANEQASELANVAIQAAERELRRSEEAWGKNLISERDYEKARDDAAAARVNHKHALGTAGLQRESLEFELSTRKLERDRQQLLVQSLERRVAELQVRSPVDGVVGSLAVSDRTSVPVSVPLMTVVDLTAFEIEFLVPESYGDDLSVGMETEVSYAGRTYAARVSSVSPEVQQGQVKGRLRFSGDAPQGLRQNQRVSARIVLESRDDVLKVARGPFLETAGGRIGYRVQGDLAVRTKIQTGASSVSEVEILEGLAPGDRIIISNLGELERVETVRLTD
jgi:HlyD family secretion protein